MGDRSTNQRGGAGAAGQSDRLDVVLDKYRYAVQSAAHSATRPLVVQSSRVLKGVRCEGQDAAKFDLAAGCVDRGDAARERGDNLH